MTNLQVTKEKEHLITFQRQAIIKLIEKKTETRGSYKTGDQFFFC